MTAPTTPPDGWVWAQRVGTRHGATRRHLIRTTEVDLPTGQRAERYDALCGQHDIRWLVLGDQVPECVSCSRKARKGAVPTAQAGHR